MNLQNIVSAGRMMSIVMALLGTFLCGVSFKPGAPAMFMIAFGVTLIIFGLALVVMIPLAERRRGMPTVVLALGTLQATLSVATATTEPHPVSWMVAIVAIAIFIDVLCLKIQLSVK